MTVQNDARVTIRVDKDLKDRAETLFGRLGLNMTTALNVFLRKAVEEEAIPFPVSAKKVTFGAGYTASEITDAFVSAVQDVTAAKQRDGYAVARYDAPSGRAYLECADGTREYVSE